MKFSPKRHDINCTPLFYYESLLPVRDPAIQLVKCATDDRSTENEKAKYQADHAGEKTFRHKGRHDCGNVSKPYLTKKARTQRWSNDEGPNPNAMGLQ